MDAQARQIERAFLSSVADIRDRAVLNDLYGYIERGDHESIMRVLGINRAAFYALEDSYAAAFVFGGMAAATSLPPLRTPDGAALIFRFDVRNPRVERYLRDYSAEMVSRITVDQRNVIRNTLAAGMEAGRNPRNVALDLVGRIDPRTRRRAGGVIGLTSQQQQFVENARQQLLTGDLDYFTRNRRDRRFDSVIRAAMNDGRAVPQETINRAVGRYSDRMLQLRGENIGRTEALEALNRGQFEALNQAVDQADIDPEAITRVWDSAGDGRTRDEHAMMDGQEVGYDEPFISPSGARLMHPGDSSFGAGPEDTINCRCTVRVKIDHTRGVR